MNQGRPIPFNVPHVLGTEMAHIQSAIAQRRLCGGGPYGEKCEKEIEAMLGHGARALLTTSCTDALEIAAALLDIRPGDEVIAPSFTFVSSVNPFVIRGARIKFVDVAYPSMNLSTTNVRTAIGPRTRAVIAVNYGGGSGDLADLRKLCDEHKILLIEDAAQSLEASCGTQPLGTFGHLAAFSFHETKNVQCGEGGALIVNSEKFLERAEIIREKGTNRANFIRGQVDKYTWVDTGSSHIPSELVAAFLYPQLQAAKATTGKRLEIWRTYQQEMEARGIPILNFDADVRHNGHIFAIFAKSHQHRNQIMEQLKASRISTTFHYIPLHSSPMGQRCGVFHGEDQVTTDCASRIIRLPIFPSLEETEVRYIAEQVVKHYQ